MKIESLDLKNYRNYSESHISFDDKVNLLYGENAQGKTNILESIYFCATTKSHRGSKDKEIISFNSDESHIKAKISKKNQQYVIDIHLKKNSPKGIAVNGIPIRKVSELFGTVNVVCFSPEDLNIIKEGPAGRRKFIDLELCQLNSLYVHSLINYNKVLIQKNKLLKEIPYNDSLKDTLDIWDEQLIKYGNEVFNYREEFIKELNEIIKDIHFNISGEREVLRIEYEKSNFKNAREEEIRQRATLYGPHRDDIAFYINDIDLRKFGSQGQQRTAALALKLSEIELAKKKTGDCPILLLDDVLSELDGNRQEHLLEAIQNIQTIITCTGVEDYINSNLHIDRIMHVEKGKVTNE